jgi:phosphoserine phosphatase RsbU/P
MLPRTSGLLAIFIALSVSSPGLLCRAQQTQPTAIIRYHFGDDPDGKLGWANPDFDDSAWPQAKNGKWPLPLPAPDSFEWTRVRVTVPADASGRLAIKVSDPYHALISFEIFVNGRPAVQRGTFRPNPEPVLVIWPGSVFDLPAGLARPGETVVVAYRVWFQPSNWTPAAYRSTTFEIGESRILHLAGRADHLRSLVLQGPQLALYFFMTLLGILLFAFWCWVRGRELLLCSAFLFFAAFFTLLGDLESIVNIPLPWRLEGGVGVLLTAAGMAFTVELVWAIHSLRAPTLKRVLQALVLISNASGLYLFLTTASSAWVLWMVGANSVSVVIFPVLLIATNLWPVFTRGKAWLFGLALAIYQIEYLVNNTGVNLDRSIGGFYVSYFDLGNLAASVALFVLLGQRGWQAWRARDELRVEFEAAREMQEQLVAPAVDLPGFKIQSAYLPAKQVGGDFFRVLPDSDGSVLVVVGDVSGKGLKAAMTVSAIMGALRGCNSRQPAAILHHLNGVLYGQIGGFVTCCVSLIAPGGAATLANAGNPAPYRNGQEMAVDPGLPLGLIPDASYTETRCQLAPNDRLTFVSDGVLEATNAQGELYGFARTEAISNQAANTIAEAATQFGQEDDITVLSVTRTVNLNPAMA